MNDTSERIWTWFEKYYAAHFPRLTPSDGIEFWAEFVGKSEKSSLMATIDELATEDRAKRGKPRLGDIKKGYFAHREKIFSLNHSASAKSDCFTCDNRGYVIVQQGKQEDGKLILLTTAQASAWAGTIFDNVIPCICSKGVGVQRKASSDYRTEWDVIERIHKYCL